MSVPDRSAPFSELLDAALPAVDNFYRHVADYTSWVEDYEEEEEYVQLVDRSINNVAESWKEVDELKQEMDEVIASYGHEIESGDVTLPVDSVERFLHTSSAAADPDGLNDIAAQNYRDLAAFNKRYVEALSDIVQYESIVRDNDDFAASPEELRMEEDEQYEPLADRIEEQIALLKSVDFE